MTAASVLLALVAGLVLLLAVPVELAFRVRGLEPMQGQFELRWLFGWVRVRLELPRGLSASASKPRAKRERPRHGTLAALRDPAFRQRAIRFVRDLLAAAQVHDLTLRLRLGLDDPADTGRLWALIWPLKLMVQRLNRARVSIEPDFTEPVLDFEGNGRVRLVPLQLLGLILAFALAPPSLRAWRTLALGHA